MPSDTYAKLAAPFDHVQKVRGSGGQMYDYLSGEQVISRLNEVLGPGGWSFAIVDKSYNVDADEAWVLGHLTANIDGNDVHREQFGSQKIARFKTNDPSVRGAIIDLGFVYKGAGTDALKKCASLLGVGLYLYDKDAPPANNNTNWQANARR